MQKRVLVVDDETAILEAMTTTLELENIEAAAASDYDGAVAMLENLFFPIILSDLRLRSDEEGLRLIETIRERAPKSRVVVMTGHATPAVERELLSRGVCMVLHKPAPTSVIVDAINALLEEIEREAGDGEIDVEELYVTLRQKLYSIPRRRFGLSHQAAEDVLQDAWLLFLRKRSLVRAAGPWLTGTVANLCRQQLHKHKRETSDEELMMGLADESGGNITDAIAIRQALSRTEERTRMLCSLIGMDGMSYDAVSAAIGIPLGSVGPLYIRAKKKIRNILAN